MQGMMTYYSQYSNKKSWWQIVNYDIASNQLFLRQIKQQVQYKQQKHWHTRWACDKGFHICDCRVSGSYKRVCLNVDSIFCIGFQIFQSVCLIRVQVRHRRLFSGHPPEWIKEWERKREDLDMFWVTY